MAEIRMATLDDVPIIVHQRNGMCADIGIGTVESRAQMDVQFDIWARQHIGDGSYLAWLACDNGEVVAGIGLWLIDWVPGYDGSGGQLPYLLNVYTEPDYRKRGLARCLVEESITYCREQGYPKMRLHASIQGRPLYESLGFTDTNDMQLVIE